MKITNLSFGDLPHPVGTDTPPALSWQLQSDREGTMQESYRIVITHGDETVWDSGVCRSECSIRIR